MSNRAMQIRIIRLHDVQLFPGAEFITLGSQVYKGPPTQLGACSVILVPSFQAGFYRLSSPERDG